MLFYFCNALQQHLFVMWLPSCWLCSRCWPSLSHGGQHCSRQPSSLCTRQRYGHCGWGVWLCSKGESSSCCLNVTILLCFFHCNQIVVHAWKCECVPVLKLKHVYAQRAQAWVWQLLTQYETKWFITKRKGDRRLTT